jgi:hypothetical protein
VSREAPSYPADADADRSLSSSRVSPDHEIIPSRDPTPTPDPVWLFYGVCKNALIYRPPTFGEQWLDYIRGRDKWLKSRTLNNTLRTAIESRRKEAASWKVAKGCRTIIYTVDRGGLIVDLECHAKSDVGLHREYSPWDRRFIPEIGQWDVCEAFARPKEAEMTHNDRIQVAMDPFGEDEEDDGYDDYDEYHMGYDVPAHPIERGPWAEYLRKFKPFIRDEDLLAVRARDADLFVAPPETPPVSPGYVPGNLPPAEPIQFPSTATEQTPVTVLDTPPSTPPTMITRPHDPVDQSLPMELDTPPPSPHTAIAAPLISMEQPPRIETNALPSSPSATVTDVTTTDPPRLLRAAFVTASVGDENSEDSEFHETHDPGLSSASLPANAHSIKGKSLGAYCCLVLTYLAGGSSSSAPSAGSHAQSSTYG